MRHELITEIGVLTFTLEQRGLCLNISKARDIELRP